jgi:uncharacterized protein (TIGR00369 family)
MDTVMTRQGPFWDFLNGRLPAPPCTELLGWQLEEIDPEAGTIQVGFHARHEFTNPTGAIQGGFLSAMLDDTLGPALAATLGPDQFAPTVELKVNFLRPAYPGSGRERAGRASRRHHRVPRGRARRHRWHRARYRDGHRAHRPLQPSTVDTSDEVPTTSQDRAIITA